MKSLADLFFEKAIENKDKLAIWCEGDKISYKDLAIMVNRYANLLIDNGVQYGDHIGITMDNNIQSVALILAAANNGVGLVPINPTLHIDSIQKAFNVADVKHIVATKRFFEKNESSLVNGKYFCLDAELENKISLCSIENICDVRPIVKQVTGNEPFIITMTSGSTGDPKPILLTQNNKYKRIIAHIKLYSISARDNILAATPLYHSLAERLVLLPLVIGGTSVLLSRFTPKRWIETVENEKVSFTIAVSAQLNQIVKYFENEANVEFKYLRCLVSSSALLEESIRERLLNYLKCEFHEMYGTSETSTATSINFKESKLKVKSVGKPLEEADIKILNENKDFASPNEIGEILCKSTLVCEGYYKKESLFKDCLVNGYFKTGDIGYLDEDGYLYYSGREKELIITGGINVYPNDIDNCIAQMPEVEECAAFAIPDEKLGEIVAVAVKLNPQTIISTRDIQRYCAKKLADFQQPQKVFFVNELPKNAMGKLMRTKIYDFIKLGD